MPARTFFSDTIELHRKMQDLAAAIEVEYDPEEMTRLAGELITTLIPHVATEEDVLYAALKDVVDQGSDRNVLLEAHQAHTMILELVEKMQNVSAESEEFQGIVLLLDRLMSLHIEQEEQHLYEMARRYLDYDDFSDLATRMQETQQRRLKETREDARRTKRAPGMFGRRRDKEKDVAASE